MSFLFPIFSLISPTAIALHFERKYLTITITVYQGKTFFRIFACNKSRNVFRVVALYFVTMYTKFVVNPALSENHTQSHIFNITKINVEVNRKLHKIGCVPFVVPNLKIFWAFCPQLYCNFIFLSGGPQQLPCMLVTECWLMLWSVQ